MDPSLLEQFLGPSSTQFQLPVLPEDENDELHPLVSTGFQRLSITRKSLPGKENYMHTQGLVYSTHIYIYLLTLLYMYICLTISSSLNLFKKNVRN